ncbi:MAG: hypothetical protein U0229_09200 [Anaeromyxobacter sp.]
MQPETRIPDYLLERLAADDLPPAEAQALRARLAAEPGGEERLRALRTSDAELLLRHPARVIAAEVHRRSDLRPAPRRPLVTFAPWLAAAAAVLVAVPLALRAPRQGDDAGVDGERTKGLSATLVLHRRTSDGAEVLGPGARARGGDLIQVGYVSAGAPYGAIVSIDGAGNVTRHWPMDGDRAAPLDAGREVLLPESFRLDDAPGFERFVLVTGKEPFGLAPVLGAARDVAARADAGQALLPLPKGLAQSSALLPKVTP